MVGSEFAYLPYLFFGEAMDISLINNDKGVVFTFDNGEKITVSFSEHLNALQVFGDATLIVNPCASNHIQIMQNHKQLLDRMTFRD